ncbi:MAG: DUF4292 domain-containing protein [Paludibacteraceae bacterium]|nr:DUF4292 domain-containing protein [Paludibacteraceae bacterium]
MWNKSVKWLLAITLIFSLAACKTSQRNIGHAGKTTVSKTTVEWQKKYHNNLKTINGKLKIEMSNPSMTLKGSLRAISDSAMQISLQAFLGIEIASIWCDKNGILIIDRYHGNYCEIPYSSMQNYMPVSLNALESVIFNRYFDPFKQGLESYETGTDGTNSYLWTENNNSRLEFTNNHSQQLVRTALKQTTPQGYLTMDYRLFDAAQNFPQTQDLKFYSNKMLFDLSWTFEKIAYNETVDLPYPSTKNLKKVSFETLYKSLMK